MDSAEKIEPERQALMEKFGVRYFEPGEQAVVEANIGELYSYEAFIGEHLIELDPRDSLCYLAGPRAVWTSTPGKYQSDALAVKMRGYAPPERIAQMPILAHLPYVNGCSTAQIFPPLRAGDPTLQWLNIPPYSAEQAHHIHSTVRVVYIAGGKGRSLVGMEGGQVVEELYEGKVIVLDPMCPHHFDTPQGEHLICVPFHVYSSTPVEFNHPMYLGTHLMDQGG